MRGDLEDMGMLKSIKLENYKCFKDETKIDIAPLTVLCGVNSSGKSSILKSLLMLKQSYENAQTKGQIVFSGNYVDNGSFKDVVYNNSGKNFKITTTFTVSKPQMLEYNRNQFLADKSNFNELKRIFKNVVDENNLRVCDYEIEVSLVVEGDDNPKTQIQAIKNHISQYDIGITLLDNNGSRFSSKISIYKLRNRLYKITFTNFPLLSTDSDNNICINETIEDCHCYFDGLKIIKLFSDKPSKSHNMNDFLPNLYIIFSIISEQYSNMKHISPLRYLQNRRYTLTSGISEMSPNGEDMLQVLAQYGTKTIDYCKVNEHNNFTDTTKDTLIDATRWWSSYLQTGEIELVQNEELLKLNISGHNIIDVGIGVGQSLPIIIDGLFSPMNSVFMIEQPEIHLHPRAQMSMADFLISLSLSNKKIIVETHSDHIINRLVKRIMMDTSGKLNNYISICFIDKNAKNPVEKISISPSRGIVEAPTNFFTQFASETMEIAKIGFENHKEGIEWSCNK